MKMGQLVSTCILQLRSGQHKKVVNVESGQHGEGGWGCIIIGKWFAVRLIQRTNNPT